MNLTLAAADFLLINVYTRVLCCSIFYSILYLGMNSHFDLGKNWADSIDLR